MKFLAILRGINVSGQKKIIMAELKSLFESLEFENVKTYIQSGNVIFESEIRNITELKKQIENAIEKEYDFHVTVLIRTEEDILKLISCNPYNPVDLAKEGTKVLVTFLENSPLTGLVGSLETFKGSNESFEVQGDHLYLYCPDGYGKTKLSNNLIGKKLNLQATTRNWKTVIKLSQMFN